MSQRYVAPFAPGGSAAVDAARASRLLSIALARGGSYADLFFEYEASGSYGFEDGILKSAGRGVSLGLGVRVRKGDATGYAYTEDLSVEATERAAKIAGQIADGGRTIDPVGLSSVAPPHRYDVKTPTLDVAGEIKRELLRRADVAARAADPRIKRVEASLAEEYREILIATSDGKLVHDVQPLMRFGIRAIAEQNGKRQAGNSGGGGRMDLAYFDGKSPEWHAREAVRQALVMLDARDAPAGTMDVVLAPGDSGILLHEAVGHGLEADFNRKRTSNYTDQIGQVVASELCTVIDDARLVGSRGSIDVDDEGNVPEAITLIEKGVLRGYMQDRQSAEYFETSASGNGRRESFRSHPMPRMTNTMLLEGPHDPGEILESVERGIFASRFGGGQVDISNGDFVFSLTEAYLIENGKITAPLKGVQLIGNGPEVMRKVTMLGSDMQLSDGIWTCGKDGQSVPVGVACPTIKIAGITVGGTQVG
jgi:TldD protein